jgi:hypothetical protein
MEYIATPFDVTGLIPVDRRDATPVADKRPALSAPCNSGDDLQRCQRGFPLALRFTLVVLVVLALASAAAATRTETSAYRGAVRVTFSGSGTARYANAHTTKLGPGCTFVEREDTTETFNWKYTWARISLKAWNADSHGWYSSALAYTGGPGRVRGEYFSDPCTADPETLRCDKALTPLKQDSGWGVTGAPRPKRKHPARLILQPGFPQLEDETGCNDVLNMTEFKGPNERTFDFLSTPNLRMWSRARPGFSKTYKMPQHARPDVNCGAPPTATQTIECTYTVHWTGSVTITRIP